VKILLINPNVTEEMTATMLAEAKVHASAGTSILSATAQFGTQYVETRYEAAIASHAVLDCLAANKEACDAAIISAFGDPGLAAAKELMAFPVVGIEEAALLTAYMLGRRYSIICLTERLRTWYIESAREADLDGRLASVRSLNASIPDIMTAKDDFTKALHEICLQTIEHDRAEVVIFGGGPIAGLARELQSQIPVPALDGISCAVRMAEYLVRLGVRPPMRGSFAKSAPKPAKGLSPQLSDLVGATPLIHALHAAGK